VAEILINIYADSSIYKKYFIPERPKIVENKPAIRKPNRDSLIYFANNFLGIPYKWAGTSPTSGFDCSGFTQYIYRKVGIELIHFAKEQAKIGTETDWKFAAKGDLIFFGKRYENGKLKIDHVGIFHSINESGNPLIIHCSSAGTCYQELKPGDYWSKKLLFCKNVIDENTFLTNK
jgi:cell wall-associated NlpC family hydrolase